MINTDVHSFPSSLTLKQHQARFHRVQNAGSAINTLATVCLALVFLVTGIGISKADVIDVSTDSLTMNRELSKDVQLTLRNVKFHHYVSKNLDDEYSARTLNSYLDLLDPNKIYFTKSDIDALQIYRHSIDDYLKRGNAEIAFDIFKIFRERINARTELVRKLVNTDFDYKLKEQINIDRDSYDWAESEEAMEKIWRKRIKNDTLQQLMAETPIEEIRQNLIRRYQRQRDVIFQLKSDEVFEWFMNAYVKEIGPHTQYMSHITAENFRVSMSLSLEGIGAALQTEQDYTVINRILPGGPAEKSRLINPEDKIVAVAQDKEEMINVVGWRLTDVVQMIRGDKGTKVRLEILKNGSAPGSPPETIELVRDVIQLEDQAAKLSQVELSDGDRKRMFSVISIPSFYSNSGQAKDGAKYTATTHDVKKLLKQVNNSSSEGLVIDLRGNGGGYLNEAVSLTGLFIEQGPVVQVVQSNQKKTILNDKNELVAYSGPMVVLIDRYSASASEIFAAAMQDYGRALIVGERSFGKGTVQRVTPLRYGNNISHESQIKLTTAQFFRVNGGSTQHKGVTPDIDLNSGIEDDEFGERAYDNALPWSKIQAAAYKPEQLPTNLINHLSEKHLGRSKTSAAFTLLRQSSERITRNRNIKTLSLNLLERQLYRDQIDTESLAQLNIYRTSLELDPVTEETRSDNPLPNEEEHWNIVFHTEAARILMDQSNWSNAVLTKQVGKIGS